LYGIGCRIPIFIARLFGGDSDSARTGDVDFSGYYCGY
jgi:hypothetical protein